MNSYIDNLFDLHFFGSWKVEELEKEILESREKIEFCRTKMQELVSVSFLIIIPFILALKSSFLLYFFVMGLWWQVQNRFKPLVHSYPLDAFTMFDSCLKQWCCAVSFR